MVDQKIGGVNVFGGALALYDTSGHLVGGLGVSGDTSCTDHVVAWKVRHLFLARRFCRPLVIGSGLASCGLCLSCSDAISSAMHSLLVLASP